jgi:Mce-associated membrane protein
MRVTRIPALRFLRRRRHPFTTKAQTAQLDTDVAAVAVDGMADLPSDDLRRSAKSRWHRYMRKPSAAVAAGLSILLVLSGLTGWLGYRTYEAGQAQQRRALFLEVGRQGALNLTTISDTEAEADMKRILESSTGAFYAQVQNGSQQFVALVQKAQTKSVGTIAAAGVESEQDDRAQVLVTVHVNAADTGGSQQPARSWRMRITVQQVAGGAKMSNVEFMQ